MTSALAGNENGGVLGLGDEVPRWFATPINAHHHLHTILYVVAGIVYDIVNINW